MSLETMRVRVWHDHCLQRIRCPWSIQVLTPSGSVRESVEAYIWTIHGGAVPNNLVARGIAGLNHLTTEYTGVARVSYFTDITEVQGRTIEA